MAKPGLKALYEREIAIRPPDVLAEVLRARQAEVDALFFGGGELRLDLVTWRRSCPVCGTASLCERPKAKGWPMARCTSCGVETIHAVPTRAAWAQFYATSRADAMFHRKVYEGTKEKRFASIDEPRARWVTDRCPTKGSLLDVGCSSGTFLEAIQAAGGWECHGVEPSPEAVSAAREKGLANVVCAQLEEYASEMRFDALTCFGVLTQVDDPRASMTRLASMMKPNSRVFITDMNFAGFYAAVTGEDHASFVPPLLKTFLTSATIVTLLESLGFRDVEITTPGTLDLVRVWMYWQAGGDSGKNEALYRMIERELETDSSALQDLVVASRASEHMWVTARRG